MNTAKTGFTLNTNVGVTFANTTVYNGTYNGNMFAKFYLLGKTVTFTVDISKIGCSCVGTLYLYAGPPILNGVHNPGAYGNFYCDANNSSGLFCPE